MVDIGLASTDQLWFASGSLDLPGAQLTASHNPAAYNGIKFCLAGARPMTPQMLIEIRDRAWQIERDGFAAEQAPGRITEEDLLPAYSDYLRSLVDLSGMRHLRVVVDAGNGMAGLTAPVVLAGLDLELIGLYLELDGSFPTTSRIPWNRRTWSMPSGRYASTAPTVHWSSTVMPTVVS